MKWRNRAVRELIAITALAVAVIVLAVLQYRWASEISRTEQSRLQTALGRGIKNFEQEFAYDFEKLCESFAIGPQTSGSELEPDASRRYVIWSQTTSDPGFLAGLYIWRVGQKGAFRRLDTREDRFRQASWPTELRPLSGRLSGQARRIPSILSDRDAVYYPWTFYSDVPALVRPLFRVRSTEKEADDTVEPAGFLILELNRAYLEQQYLPDLVGRDLSDAGFDVAIRTAKAPYENIYLSNPDFPTTRAPADAVVDLVDLVSAESRRRGFAPVQPGRKGEEWQLVVRHPGGSLEVAVAGWRRRNLAISFGLLGILVGSAVLTLVAARRAERLARLQMEFVAGISHELCTPLAVIGSAAENLADGIVEDAGKVQAYGGMIREQNRRLELLVDDVLLFAAGKFGRGAYELHPLDVGPVVERTLTALEAELREAGVAVEKEIGERLPPVLADPTAVSKCLGNLVSNAVKYAGAKRWIAVRVRPDGEAAGGEVQIVVEDRGMGIPAAERGNIFQPFYRAQVVRDGEARGVGLGLYLVKQMMEAMGGTVTVASELGQGAKFVLHFPVVFAGEPE